MPQPTFSTLKDTSTFYNEVIKKQKELGPVGANNGPAWQKFTDDITKEIDDTLKLYENEEKAYFIRIGEQMMDGKTLVGQASAVAAQVVSAWNDKDRAILDNLSGKLKTIIANIAQAKKDCVAHQGLRGNLGFNLDGVPPALEKYEVQFKARRKVIIDQHDALMSKVDKLKIEYVARIANSIKLADNAKAANGQTLTVVKKELTELAKIVALWRDVTSDKFEAIHTVEKKLSAGLKVLENGKNVAADSFDSLRASYPQLKKAVQTTKESLNSDYKRYETLKTSLGGQIYIKDNVDQKLVTLVEKGFEKAREDIKVYYVELENMWEKKISTLQKKRLKK